MKSTTKKLLLGVLMAVCLAVLMAVCTGAEDVTYSGRLEFTSNGDGTCYVSGIKTYKDTDIVIPPVSPEGDTVTSIGKAAFSFCGYLRSIVIPESVTSIGREAFSYCIYLRSIVIPESVTSIGNYAFQGCSGLTSIVIPESVTSIGDYAFQGCSGLTSITIPASVERIGQGAFSSCMCIEEIYFYATAMNDLAHNNLVFRNAGKNGAGIKVVIGKDVTKIPACLFNSNNTPSDSPNIVSVEFEEGSICESIGQYAFSNCSGLKSFTIGAGVTDIGNYVIAGCTSLESLLVAPGNTMYYSRGNCVIRTETKEVVIGCLTSVIPNDGSVTRIGDYAFKQCTGLTYIDIPNSVTSIGNGAFYDCTGLTKITIPESVTIIWQGAFFNCMSLEEIYFNAKAMEDLYPSNKVFSYAGLKGTGIKVVIGKNVTKIPAYLFDPDISNSRSPMIVSVKFQEGSVCKSIGAYAFGHCPSMTSITMPDGVNRIGKGAFYNCEGMTSITIPESVTFIDVDAFYSCHGLTSITIPKNVTTICNRAFAQCTGLESLTVAAGNTTFYSRGNCIIYTKSNSVAFGCLVSEIPSDGSVTGISGYAFAGWQSLTSITIPESVTSIGNFAFHECRRLEEIYFNATAMTDLKRSNYVFMYAGASVAGIRVYIGKNVTKIPSFLFDPYDTTGAPRIVSVEFEEGSVCESIGNYAFAHCTSMTSINIPDNVISIGEYAFYNCPSLTSIAIPDRVTSMGNNAFRSCVGLTSIVIPDSMTNIGDYTFHGCMNLTSIVIPDSVTNIGNYAFNHCTALADVYYFGTKEEWNNITIGSNNAPLLNATIHFIGDWEKIVVDPTCTEKGYTYDKCNCGKFHNYYNETDPLGHNMSVWGITAAPTCITAGEERRECLRDGCDHFETRSIDMLEHDYECVTLIVDHCMEEGKKVFTCSWCGDSYEEPIPPRGHSKFKWLYFTQTNELMATCLSCRDILVQQEKAKITGASFNWGLYLSLKYNVTIPCIPYYPYETVEVMMRITYDDEVYWVEGFKGVASGEYIFELDQIPPAKKCGIVKAELCVISGIDVVEEENRYWSDCFVIAEHISEVIGHNLTSHAAQDPTCTEVGWNAYVTCICCGYTDHEEIPALGHAVVIAPAQTPTCTETGLTEGKHCSVCGEVFVAQTEVPAKGHAEVIDPAKSPTCSETGLTEGKHCSVCGEVLTAQTEIPANGHSEAIDPAKASTCTETGLTEGKHCSVCGEVLVAQTEVPATGHTEVTDSAVASTCTETGLTEGKHCATCGEVLTPQIEIPAIGHTEVIDPAKASTCTETGLTEGKHCSVCGEVFVAQTEVPAKGHAEIIDPAKSPTCTETGLTEGKHCSVCNEILAAQSEVSAPGHVSGDWVIVTEPAIGAEGKKQQSCTVCGEVLNEETIPALPEETEPETHPETDPVTEPETPEETTTASDGQETITIPVDGCSGSILSLGLIMTIALAGAALIKRKE